MGDLLCFQESFDRWSRKTVFVPVWSHQWILFLKVIVYKHSQLNSDALLYTVAWSVQLQSCDSLPLSRNLTVYQMTSNCIFTTVHKLLKIQYVTGFWRNAHSSVDIIEWLILLCSIDNSYGHEKHFLLSRNHTRRFGVRRHQLQRKEKNRKGS